MTDTVTAKLAEWEALTEGATEGPWAVEEDDYGEHAVYQDEGDSAFGTAYIAEGIRQGHDEGRADANFIAAARHMVPALLGFVREVREVHVRKHAVFSWQSGLRYEDPCSTCDGKAGVHECGCWADSDIEYVCEGCEQAGPKRQPVPWPCPTEQAARKWLGGQV